MAKGENIFKRGDGRWEARYIKEHGLSGKIRYGFCYGKTYREAKYKVTEAKTALIKGTKSPVTNMRRNFSFFCDEWLKAGKSRFKESTLVKYSSVLEKHIKPRLGGCSPLSISDSIISAFTNEMLFDEELSRGTVRNILVILRSVLNYTAKQFPGVFPKLDICYPKPDMKKTRVLTKEEQSQFIHCLLTDMDECKFGVLLALLTGLRIGEICALRWENISLAEGTVTVSSTMQRLADMDTENGPKTKIVIGSPKSRSSSRTIPMCRAACVLCKKMKPKSLDAFVLTGTSNYMEPRLLQYRMERYTKACGLEGVHFHTLRHTFATRCMEAGFEIKSLSEVLGHANTSITLDLYIHSSMELKRRNMNKLSMVDL